MITSIATSNIIHKTIGDTFNVIYEPCHSLFDKVWEDINANFYNNVILDGIYDTYISNNFLKYSTQRSMIVQQLHISDIVFIHEELGPKFKKEDKIILNNNLNDSYKILIHKKLLESWGFLTNKTQIIEYGIHKTNIKLNNKKKSIVVLNLNKNKEIDILYQHIKNIYTDAEIIMDLNNKSWDDIYQILSSYKICIDEKSIYNQLVASYCNCIIVTPNIQFDNNIIGYFNINNFNQISYVIEKILSSYDTYNFNNQNKYLKTNYSFEKFKENIENLFAIVKKEIFII